MFSLKIFVTIPTYNEVENIGKLIRELLKNRGIEIAVFDDSSPDGTWKVVKEMGKKEKRVRLILKETKSGRGNAEIDMMKYCLKNRADVMIEMDADLSHDPRYVRDILKEIKSYDVVVGSRNVAGGKDVRGDIMRATVTFLAQTLMKIILGINMKDPSSGYRGFNKRALESINFSGIAANGKVGMIVCTETIYACFRKGLKIKEIPILFKNRTAGKSKLIGPILFLRYVIEMLKIRLFSRA
ncbi:MAG TPA: glycosyltransferase [archaeon]|nr:glycosyltransferase [archaeon]